MIDFEEFSEYYESIRFIGVGQSYDEAYNLCKFTLQTNLIEGDIVEVGVAQGGSAKIISNYKSKTKKMYLFDTFEGLMDCSEKDAEGYLINGIMSYPEQGILDLFKDDDSVKVVKGYFPESAYDTLANSEISLLHLDVDTYRSTLGALEYCYDKISPGGVIICHDYLNNANTKGVQYAVNEFFVDKKEFVCIGKNSSKTEKRGAISHCIIVKL